MRLVIQTWQLMESSPYAINCQGIYKNEKKESRAMKTSHNFYNVDQKYICGKPKTKPKIEKGQQKDGGKMVVGGAQVGTVSWRRNTGLSSHHVANREQHCSLCSRRGQFHSGRHAPGSPGPTSSFFLSAILLLNLTFPVYQVLQCVSGCVKRSKASLQPLLCLVCILSSCRHCAESNVEQCKQSHCLKLPLSGNQPQLKQHDVASVLAVTCTGLSL